MTPEQARSLQAHRDRQAVEIAAMLNTPEAERPTKPSALRAWLRDLDHLQSNLAQLDGLLRQGRRAKGKQASQVTRAPQIVETARFAINTSVELRVQVLAGPSGRMVDVREWARRQDAQAWSRSLRGVAIPARSLALLISALQAAQQHVPKE